MKSFSVKYQMGRRMKDDEEESTNHLIPNPKNIKNERRVRREEQQCHQYTSTYTTSLLLPFPIRLSSTSLLEIAEISRSARHRRTTCSLVASLQDSKCIQSAPKNEIILIPSREAIQTHYYPSVAYIFMNLYTIAYL